MKSWQDEMEEHKRSEDNLRDALTPFAHAQPRLVANVAAWHSSNRFTCPDEPGRTFEYETWTPGIGLGYDFNESVMGSVGVWDNSHDNLAGYAIVDWRPLRAGRVSAGLFGGAGNGYCYNHNRIGPIGGLTARWDATDVLAVHLMYVPKFERFKNASSVGLVLSGAF